MGRAYFSQAYFTQKEMLFYKDTDFEVSTFRYESGVPAVRMKNSVGYLILLPYHGQMIWDTAFYGKTLKMETSFLEPKPVIDFLNTYGCYLMHCGPRRICADPEENHQLHGDLPFALYDSASLLFGEDDLGRYIALTGTYTYNRMFGDHFCATPICRLYVNSSIIRVSMSVENRSAYPMDFMYLFHVNNPLRKQGRFVQPLHWTHADMTLRSPGEADPMPPESAEQRRQILADPSKSAQLLDDTLYAPEFSIELRNPVGDENHIAHFMQVHADGGADYTGVPLDADIRWFSRWITRTKNHSACSLCSPATCGPGGYTEEKKAGRVIVMEPGEEKTVEIFAGYLDQAQALQMEEKISAVLR